MKITGACFLIIVSGGSDGPFSSFNDVFNKIQNRLVRSHHSSGIRETNSSGGGFLRGGFTFQYSVAAFGPSINYCSITA